MQMEVCTEQVEWAKAEKRTFLRQRIEARLANLYLSNKDYSSALSLISRLLTEASILQHVPLTDQHCHISGMGPHSTDFLTLSAFYDSSFLNLRDVTDSAAAARPVLVASVASLQACAT